MTETDLVGVWRLVSYVDVDDAGEIAQGPLGPAPEGLLLYTSDGYMSVAMTPGERPGAETFMGYAGRWRRSGDQIVHEVAVSSHQHLTGTSQVRDVALADGLLTVRGVSYLRGRPRRRVLTWRRVPRSHLS